MSRTPDIYYSFATALPTTQLSQPPTLSRSHPVFTTYPLFSQLPYRTHTAHLATAYVLPTQPPPLQPTHRCSISLFNLGHPLRFPVTSPTTRRVAMYHLFPRDGFPIAARKRSPPLSSLNRARVRRVANVDLPRFEGHSLRSLGHWRQNRPLLHRGEAHEGRPLAEHAAIANDDGLR